MNPYQVLEISPTATPDEVRVAYRKLAKKYHPDLNPGKVGAESKFKELNAANAILSDPETRGKFDRGEIDDAGSPKSARPQEDPSYYQTQRNAGRYSSQFEDSESDLFESIFGAGRRRAPRTKGADQHYRLAIEFAEAVLGAEKEITLPTGKTLKVKIPLGIETGQKLRFKGLGDAAPPGAVSGDAFVEIEVRPSRLFKRVGPNLEMELPVSVSEVLLGAEVMVPALGSAVLLKIPPGANTGTKLKIRGKGVGAVPPKERGDLIVTLKVMMPTKPDPALQEAIRNWAKDHSYDPRTHFNETGGPA